MPGRTSGSPLVESPGKQEMAYVPERGDVVWISLHPRAGHKQAGRRPAVVVSPKTYNGKVGLGLFCPITSQVRGYPFEVVVPQGLAVGGVVLADQVKRLDWRVRKAEFAGRLPADARDEVLGKLGALLEP